MIKEAIKRAIHSLALVFGANGWLWSTGLKSELGFWDRYLSSGGLHWKEDFERRLDPLSNLQSRPANILQSNPAFVLDVLDVGAGPMTYLGKCLDGHELRITAVDPLAEGYAELMTKHGIHPLVTTQYARAEELEAKFAPDSFDLVFARNCIDHSQNPVTAIAQMLRAVRVGGYVLLEHWPNEGKNEKYRGLHQWNFDCQAGHFIIWNQRARVDVGEHFSGICFVTCVMDTEEGKPMVVVTLRKELLT